MTGPLWREFARRLSRELLRSRLNSRLRRLRALRTAPMAVRGLVFRNSSPVSRIGRGFACMVTRLADDARAYSWLFAPLQVTKMTGIGREWLFRRILEPVRSEDDTTLHELSRSEDARTVKTPSVTRTHAVQIAEIPRQAQTRASTRHTRHPVPNHRPRFPLGADFPRAS